MGSQFVGTVSHRAEGLWQEREASGHIVSAAWKQRGCTLVIRTAVCVVFYSAQDPRPQDVTLIQGRFPFSRNTLLDTLKDVFLGCF